MIDSDGFRSNVGIILCNAGGRVFWARRIGRRGWQFPQGGIGVHESPEDAMYRELWEETSLESNHVSLIGRTRSWLHYRLPKHLIRRYSTPLCIGQKQIWFLLRLQGGEDCFHLDCTSNPEFDTWKWVDYWHPVSEVITFKRRVYRCALTELAPLLFESGGGL